MFKSSRLHHTWSPDWKKSREDKLQNGIILATQHFHHSKFLVLSAFFFFLFFKKLLDILHPVATKTNVRHTKTVAAKHYWEWKTPDIQLVKRLTCKWHPNLLFIGEL